MKKEDQSYLYLILIHLIIGVVVFLLPFTAKIYGYSIFIFGVILLFVGIKLPQDRVKVQEFWAKKF